MAALRDYLIVRGVDLFHVANLNNSEALNKLVLLLISRNCDRCDGLSVATHVCANSRSESKPPRARSVAGINRELRVEGTVCYRVFIKRRSNKQKSIETQVAYGAIRSGLSKSAQKISLARAISMARFRRQLTKLHVDEQRRRVPEFRLFTRQYADIVYSLEQLQQHEQCEQRSTMTASAIIASPTHAAKIKQNAPRDVVAEHTKNRFRLTIRQT